MSKWLMVGFASLMAVFCLFSYSPLMNQINAGLIAEPNNGAWRFLDRVFPVGWLVVAFIFVIIAIYAAMTED
jgi:uncharacterized membrane protein (DUF485 family)